MLCQRSGVTGGRPGLQPGSAFKPLLHALPLGPPLSLDAVAVAAVAAAVIPARSKVQTGESGTMGLVEL